MSINKPSENKLVLHLRDTKPKASENESLEAVTKKMEGCFQRLLMSEKLGKGPNPIHPEWDGKQRCMTIKFDTPQIKKAFERVFNASKETRIQLQGSEGGSAPLHLTPALKAVVDLTNNSDANVSSVSSGGLTKSPGSPGSKDVMGKVLAGLEVKWSNVSSMPEGNLQQLSLKRTKLEGLEKELSRSKGELLAGDGKNLQKRISKLKARLINLMSNTLETSGF